jgi:hypothetical protein
MYFSLAWKGTYLEVEVRKVRRYPGHMLFLVANIGGSLGRKAIMPLDQYPTSVSGRLLVIHDQRQQHDQNSLLPGKLMDDQYDLLFTRYQSTSALSPS